MPILIATPTFDSRVHASYMLGVLGFLLSYREKFDCALNMVHGTLVDRARDDLAEQALQSGHDLFFIDSDIGFAPRAAHDFLVRAHEADVPIVCAPYPRRSGMNDRDGFFSVAIPAEGSAPNEFGLYPVDAVPTGFTLIRHRVLEAIARIAPTYTNNSGTLHRFFPFIQDGDKLYGEDFSFCRLAREAGFQAFAMPGIPLVHEGSKSYAGAWGPDSLNVA